MGWEGLAAGVEGLPTPRTGRALTAPTQCQKGPARPHPPPRGWGTLARPPALAGQPEGTNEAHAGCSHAACHGGASAAVAECGADWRQAEGREGFGRRRGGSAVPRPTDRPGTRGGTARAMAPGGAFGFLRRVLPWRGGQQLGQWAVGFQSRAGAGARAPRVAARFPAWAAEGRGPKSVRDSGSRPGRGRKRLSAPAPRGPAAAVGALRRPRGRCARAAWASPRCLPPRPGSCPARRPS